MVKTRILLAAGAALSAAAALALTVPTLAGATATPAAATAATHMVPSGKLAGAVRPVGAGVAAARSAPVSGSRVSASTGQAATAASAASCSEPDCNMQYHGGPVQHSPHVYLLLWGPKWKSAAAEKAALGYLQKFYKGLGKSPQDTWSVTTMQYGDR